MSPISSSLTWRFKICPWIILRHVFCAHFFHRYRPECLGISRTTRAYTYFVNFGQEWVLRSIRVEFFYTRFSKSLVNLSCIPRANLCVCYVPPQNGQFCHRNSTPSENKFETLDNYAHFFFLLRMGRRLKMKRDHPYCKFQVKNGKNWHREENSENFPMVWMKILLI